MKYSHTGLSWQTGLSILAMTLGVLVPRVAGGEDNLADFILEDVVCKIYEMEFAGTTTLRGVGVAGAKDQKLSGAGRAKCNLLPSPQNFHEARCAFTVNDDMFETVFAVEATSALNGGFMTWRSTKAPEFKNLTVYVHVKLGQFILEDTTLLVGRKMLKKRECNGTLSVPKKP